MIFLRQSHNVKPLRWGSPADIEYAIKVNAEKVYDVDPDSIVLAMPLFFGLPCIDYSGHRNDGVNHGAYYKDGELEFDGVGDYVDCGYDASLDLTIGTVEMWFKPAVAFSAGSDPSMYLITGGPSHYYFSASSSLLYFFLDDGDIRCYSDNNSWDTNWYHAVVTSDGIIAKMYIDGAVQSNTGDAIGHKLFIFNTNIRISHEFDGAINRVQFYNCPLSADQIALFHALPYGLYQPVIRPVYSWPASPSLSVSALDGASLLDSFSLTQKHEIAIQELLGASLVETLNLTQKHLLILQELLSSTFVDSLVLIQKHLLTVQELSGAGALDNVVLIQKHLLIIQELLSSGVLDNVALTQKHLLALQVLLSLGVLDAVSLTQKHTIIVQALLSGGLLDNINLIQKHLLVLQGLLSAETLDSVDLTQKHLLALQELISSGLIDNIEIDIGLISILLSQETEYNIALSQEGGGV